MSGGLFGTPAPQFSRTQKLAAIERELKYRRRVYPRRIEAGQMTDGLADTQIKLMEAIAADYAPNKCDDCGNEFPQSAQPIICADCAEKSKNVAD